MFERYITYLESSGLSKHTIQNYKTSWKRFERWMHRNEPYVRFESLQATQMDIAEFKRYLMEKGGRNGAPASPATLQLTFVHLNAIFKFFVKEGLIPDNPVEPIRKPPAPRRMPKWHTRIEENTFLRTIRGSSDNEKNRDYAMVILMLRAGLRVQELCDVRMDDVKLSDRSGEVYVAPKGDFARSVPLNQEVRTALIAYLKVRKSQSAYLFVSRRSGKFTTRGVQHVIEKYRYRAKLPDLTCHTLRHSFGHDLATAENPVPLDQIAMLMGHFKKDGTPNIEMTMIYTTPGQEDLVRAVNVISGI